MTTTARPAHVHVPQLTTAMRLESLFESQRSSFAVDPDPPLAERRMWLARLEQLLLEHEVAIAAAISQDFGHRSASETRLVELFPSLEAIRHARRRLPGWMKPERRRVSPWFRPARAQVRYQPLGVVGIVVPWNYPLYLTIGPLVAALAAGNRVLIKLSEYTPTFGALFADLIARHFPMEIVHVVLGDAQIGRAFVQLPFDHLLFTGSTSVGRDVMASASQHLTPLTLELGGKSPALILPDVDLARAARRIAFGKLVNAGQTCIAPDYVLAPHESIPALIAGLRVAARGFYGDAASVDYTSIASERHFDRLTSLLSDARDQGARIEPLLELPATALPRRFAPLVVLDTTPTMRVRREEIFGPLLPLVGYDTIDEAIACIRQLPAPLALYLFDDEGDRRERLLRCIPSGGVTINDTLLHVAQDDLPFGGIGESGLGCYHGIEGFRRFSHARSIFRQSRFALTSMMYPPYGGRLASYLLARMIGTRLSVRHARDVRRAPARHDAARS